MSAAGPYDTEQDALADAYEMRGLPRDRKVIAHYAELSQACDEAGVDVGGYDRQVLAWLAGWESSLVQSIAGLIRRAGASMPRP